MQTRARLKRREQLLAKDTASKPLVVPPRSSSGARDASTGSALEGRLECDNVDVEVAHAERVEEVLDGV